MLPQLLTLPNSCLDDPWFELCRVVLLFGLRFFKLRTFCPAVQIASIRPTQLGGAHALRMSQAICNPTITYVNVLYLSNMFFVSKIKYIFLFNRVMLCFFITSNIQIHFYHYNMFLKVKFSKC